VTLMDDPEDPPWITFRFHLKKIAKPGSHPQGGLERPVPVARARPVVRGPQTRGQAPDLSNTQAGPSRGAKRRRRSSTPGAVSQGRQNKRKAPPPQSHQSSDDASDDSSDADSEGQAAIEIRRTKAAEKALQADLRKIAEVKKIESQLKKQIEIGRKAKETKLKLQGLQENIEKLERQRRDLTEE